MSSDSYQLRDEKVCDAFTIGARRDAVMAKKLQRGYEL
jgi:hypothetical protein